MRSSPATLDWIQSLRGFAAFLIVIVHSRFLLASSNVGKTVADTVLYPMAMGVDLFFLISGFLMVLTTSNFDGSRRYALIFFIKRMARIWPIYVFASIFAVAYEHHGIHGFRDPLIVQQFLEGIVFIPHDPVRSPLYFLMLVNVAWTLCFEFYFYVVFAASLMFGRYRYAFIALWFAGTLICVPLLRGHFTLDLSYVQPIPDWRYANLAINPILWDFIVGMLGAGLYKSAWKPAYTAPIYVAMAIAIGALISFWDRWSLVNFHGPMGWGAPLYVFFLGIILLSKSDEIRLPRFTIWLGDISYSLYLTHLFTFALVMRAVNKLGLDHVDESRLDFVIRPILAVAGAGLVYKFLERPSSEWFRNALMYCAFGQHRKRHFQAPSDPSSAGPP